MLTTMSRTIRKRNMGDFFSDDEPPRAEKRDFARLLRKNAEKVRETVPLQKKKMPEPKAKLSRDAVHTHNQEMPKRNVVSSLSSWKEATAKTLSSVSPVKQPSLKKPRIGGGNEIDHSDEGIRSREQACNLGKSSRKPIDSISNQKSVVREPTVSEPPICKPIVREPVVCEPTHSEAVVSDLTVGDFVMSECINEEPAVKDSDIIEPVIPQFIVKEPAVHRPVIKKPLAREPFIKQPGVQESAIQKSVVGELVIREPRVQANATSTAHVADSGLTKFAANLTSKVKKAERGGYMESDSTNRMDNEANFLRTRDGKAGKEGMGDSELDGLPQFEANFDAVSRIDERKEETENKGVVDVDHTVGYDAQSEAPPQVRDSQQQLQADSSVKGSLSVDGIGQALSMERGHSVEIREEKPNLDVPAASLVEAPLVEASQIAFSSRSSSPPQIVDVGALENVTFSTATQRDTQRASERKVKKVCRAPISPEPHQSPRLESSVRSQSPVVEFEFEEEVDPAPMDAGEEDMRKATLAIAPPLAVSTSPKLLQADASTRNKSPPGVPKQFAHTESARVSSVKRELSKEPASFVPISTSVFHSRDDLSDEHRLPAETDIFIAKTEDSSSQEIGKRPCPDVKVSKAMPLSLSLPLSPKYERSGVHELTANTEELNLKSANKSSRRADVVASVVAPSVDTAPISPQLPLSPRYKRPSRLEAAMDIGVQNTEAAVALNPTSVRLSQGHSPGKPRPEKSTFDDVVCVDIDKAHVSPPASPQMSTTPTDRPKPRQEPSALYSPDGSEFEMPGASDELSEELRYSLSMLPLTNVAVYIPAFAEFEPPTANDMAVVHALEDTIQAEREKRRTDPLAIANPPRSILVIACSSTRALVFYELLSKRSKLRVATHGISERFGRGSYRNRREHFRDSAALDSLFELQDVVVTLDVTALRDAVRGFLNLRRVALIVFDIDFCMYKQDEPSFSERQHPCSIFMRDHYRALPSNHRPRVLAISSDALKPVELPPIEHNLFCRFLYPDVKEGAKWRSCYGKGSRPAGMMMDVEQLFYHVESEDDIPQWGGKDRRRSTSKMKRDPRRMSELELLTEEVGSFGVALYQRRFRHRYNGRRLGLRRTQEIVNSKFRVTDESAFTGLSQKVLHLLNELQIAYAASTRDSKLMAVIYAGRPCTASAVAEIICAIPVFEGLVVRLVIGSHQGSSFETYGSDDDGEKCGIQGEETDEEAVSVFASGEANILVVAKPYCTAIDKDPIAPCPLIFRFDDSVPDPTLDGGAGRCRVVDFQESSDRRSDRKIAPGERQETAEGQRRERDRGTGLAEGDFINQPTNQEEATPDDQKSLLQRRMNLSDALSDEEVVKTRGTQPIQKSPTAPKDEQKDGENVTIYHRRPPYVLLGPDKQDKSQCFLYRILLCEAQVSSDECPSEQEKKYRRIGVEDFVLAFSHMLGEEDKTVALRDISARAGNRTGIAAYMSLSYQGPISLSREQTFLARRYTAILFSTLSNSEDAKGVFWDDINKNSSGQSVDKTFLRGYVVLPVATSKHEKPPSRDPDNFKLSAQNAFEDYFSPGRKPEISPWPFYTCGVDWDAAQKLVGAFDSRAEGENRSNQGNLKSSEWGDLEGSFIVSRLTGENAMLCGQLQFDISPLTSLTRYRKFSLNENGTFKDHADLVHLVNLEASSETIALQTETTAVANRQNKEVNTLPKPDANTLSSTKAADDNTLRPVSWDPVTKALVVDTANVGKKRRRERAELFDCNRNVKKSRVAWTGTVCYTYEKYYTKYSSIPVEYLDQPLLVAGPPTISSYEQLLRATRGTPVSDICQELVTKDRPREMIRLVIPELCERLPLPVGAIFLPAVLVRLEQHLSLCELRKCFDSRVQLKGNIDTLRQAVTASHVDPVNNYERLELLGDSVLKLSCTVRLFTSRPHDSEGTMHTARAFRVSNERLHRLGVKVGIQNYLIFENEAVKSYRPPGTDIHGKPVKVTMKTLADVVEALCGAYFLHGVSCRAGPVEETVRKKQNKVIANNGFESSEDDMETDSYDDENNSKDIRTQEPSRNGLRASYKLLDQPLSATAVERGYIAGCKFLEVCGVFEDKEPAHREVLLAAIHAMHPEGSPAPKEISLRAFPADRRLTHPRRPWNEDFGQLETIIGYKFKRRPLLMCALTHASYVKTNGRETVQHQTFQRLEFLGDAVADFCVVRFLYERYPELGPGELTKLKSNVVSNESFARTAVRLGLHKYLFHSSSSFTKEIESFIQAVQEEREGGKGDFGGYKRTLGEVVAPKVLGDIFEAILGAVFVDSGLKRAWTVCMRLLADLLRVHADPRRKNIHPTTELQDLVMRVWKLSSSPPQYTVVSEKEGARCKVATVHIGGRAIATGRGTTLKRAKLKAAVSALELLQDEDESSVGAKLLRELREENVARMVAEQRDRC